MGTSWGFLGATNVVPGTSRERPGTVPSASESASRASQERSERPRIAQDHAKSASKQFFFDFGLSGVVQGASRARPGSDFGMTFVWQVCSFVRAFVSCSVGRSFVCSFASARWRVRSFFVVRSHMRSCARSFSRIRLHNEASRSDNRPTRINVHVQPFFVAYPQAHLVLNGKELIITNTSRIPTL